MICTSAFSTGNDHRHVRLTIHCKMGWEMSEVIQAQGRGGRDGNAARCYIIPEVNGSKPKIKKEMIDHKGRWFAYEHVYMHGQKRCLRYGTTLYIDGQGMECKEDMKNMKCSSCRMKMGFVTAKRLVEEDSERRAGRMIQEMGTISRKHGFEDIEKGFDDAAGEAKRRRTERVDKVMREVEGMRKILNRIKDHGCGFCWAMKTECKVGHKIYECKTLRWHGGSFGWYKEWKGRIRYGREHQRICWKCHVPTCGGELHGGFGDGGCEWDDVVMGTVMGIWLNKELRRQAEKELEVIWRDEDGLIEWLKKKPLKGHHSMGMDLVIWIAEEVMIE